MFIKCRFLYVYNSIRGEWLKESFSKGQKEIIFKCFKEGYTYHDIALLCDKQFNIHVTDDCIRKMIRRNGYSTPRKDKRSMCLVMSDMHIPYNRDDILDIVAKYRETIDTIILGGDIIDCESISVYKSLGKVELVDEMREAWNLLKDIQDMTPGVKRVIIYGNHEERFEKHLASIPTDIVSLHSSNILEEIVGGFDYYDHRGDKTSYCNLDYEVIDDWNYQHNDLIVCHPQSFSKVPGRTAINACEYFTRDGKSFNAIFVAHTHKIVEKLPDLNKWCYEIGCLCKPMEYSKAGKLDYTPQNNGYGIAVFKDGKFDVNRSRVYVVE